MKQAIIFVIGGVVGVVTMLLLCTSGNMPVDCSCAPDVEIPTDPLPPNQGAVIDSTEFYGMMTAFDNQPVAPVPPIIDPVTGEETPPPPETNENIGQWGGKIGALALMELVNGIQNPEDSYIYFRYGLKADGAVNKTFLMFYRKPAISVGSEALFLRSPDDAASFCPTVCNLND